MKNPHAQALGRLGGKVGGKAKSHKKTLAARRNAKLPRKKKSNIELQREAVAKRVKGR